MNLTNVRDVSTAIIFSLLQHPYGDYGDILVYAIKLALVNIIIFIKRA